ncbi:uncharacterized protein LOC135847730 isoform X5 [Planococcus citri]|uniref:uncharacterized protein LOC135847730 isoform X5 n=1 Tax=Planococcus citri TaxID=170843 RepID=UPI0031F8FF69
MADEKASNEYGIIMHPIPVSLKELSVIAVGLELWRSEINEYRKSQTSKRFHVPDKITSLRTKLPKLPSVIYDVIDEYVSRLGNSIALWHVDQIRTAARSGNYKYYQSSVFEHFDDYVGDYSYNGTVDFVKTAERMMHYDSFDDVWKFVVACRYFLEDHVRRIWPSVKEKMDLRSIDFCKNPLLYFWFCHLSNQLNKIPIEPYDTVDEKMLKECIHMSGNSLAINYFWNGVPYEDKMRIAMDLFRRNTECFVRCILPNLNNQQLEKLVNEKGTALIQALLEDRFRDETFIFRTLMCIKNLMNGSTFSNLVLNMLRIEAGYLSLNGHKKIENWLHVGCIIWNSAPHNLKRSAIIDISSDLEAIICRDDDIIRTTSSEFLLSIIPYFTSEEKQSFWLSCWMNLILNKNARDLQRIMKICLEHEDDIIKFKKNFIVESKNLQLRCVSLLSCANFDELDALVNFSCPRSAETARHLKQRLLQLCFIGESSDFRYAHVVHCEEFDSFIIEAYASIDLANDFKHQLVSSPNNLSVMSSCVGIPPVSYKALRKFIETFVSSEQILQQIKSFIVDRLKKDAVRRSSTIIDAYSKHFFDQFLLWCLGSNEHVIEFEQSYITPCMDGMQ